MESFKIFQLIAILSTLLLITVKGQIRTPCTISMITSFTPCINYITGSSSNGSTPTANCCNAFESLTNTGTECVCLVLTANVPLLPINPTLALTLLQVCNMGNTPMQCKASGTPLPAPGPVLLGPTLPPPAAAPLSPRASKKARFSPASHYKTTLPVTPASSPLQVEAPTTTPGIRPVLTPSASVLSCISPPSSLAIFIAILVLKCF